MRTCNACDKEFSPSSKHRDCPSCRYQKSKTILCSVCKERVHSFRFASCAQCANKLHANYGKGRYKKRGYIMVFQKGHPRASKNSYVLEHILVMEKFLGRYLAEGENVHHINGIKDDNRIENLELWIHPQPTGIRAKDAVAWAQKILATYEPVLEKL